MRKRPKKTPISTSNQSFPDLPKTDNELSTKKHSHECFFAIFTDYSHSVRIDIIIHQVWTESTLNY